MLDLAKIAGLIRTAIAVVSGALIGAGFDVGTDFTAFSGQIDIIIGAVGGLIAGGWSIYNKVAHKEEVTKAAITGRVETQS
jgi:hypothetical protein